MEFLMCGRYFLDLENDEIQKLIQSCAQKTDSEQVFSLQTGEIFPTDFAPVLTKNGACLMRWGFPRPNQKGVVINARIETASEKPMFQGSLHAGLRCLIPAARYFEWQAVSASVKVKHEIYDPSSPTLYMAGLYRILRENNRPAFVILTRQAAPNLSAIHSRMPVIPTKEQAFLWLNGDPVADLSQMRSLASAPLHAAPKNAGATGQLSFFPQE
jgi:putative SOS response-associated peptidase YedK